MESGEQETGRLFLWRKAQEVSVQGDDFVLSTQPHLISNVAWLAGHKMVFLRIQNISNQLALKAQLPYDEQNVV